MSKNLKYFLIAFGIIILAVAGIAYHKKPAATSLTPMTLATDYTPNTNHTGVYVAQAMGWYKAAGIDLQILPYSENVSPDVLVATGKADVGVGSTESVVTDAASGEPVVSIAAIIQHNTSSLVALADSGIQSPKDFDGKIYGGYGAPYESAVVGEIIRKNGGTGNFKNITLGLDQLEALKARKIDFTWIFDGWTGVQAETEGVKLISFPIDSNGIADYYTPVFIASPDEIKNKPELLKKFMHATAQGYEYAIAHPAEAAQMLINGAPAGTFPDTNFVMQSQDYLSAHYANSGRQWGLQDAQAWHDYPQFMLDSGSITDTNGKPVTSMNFDSLYTNQFLQQ